MGQVEWRRLTAIVMVLMMLASACSGSVPATVESSPPDSLPLAGDAAAPAESSSSTTTTLRAAPSSTSSTTSTLAPDPYRTFIATAKDHVRSLVTYVEPGGEALELPFLVPNPHQFGGPLTLMVTDGQLGDEYLKVQLPVRPNGQEAWIAAADYEVTWTRARAEVNLTERSVVVYEGDTVIAETQAVIGVEATPTPLGTFFVAAKKENTDEEYYLGPVALVLSGYSEALDSFSGGLPVIAIHGTHRPEQIGQARSNGCIRVPNDVIEFLAEHVPLGAPVHVSV